MQDIHYQKKIFVLPDNWNELTGKQLIAISKILNHKNIKPEAAELQILKVLLQKSSFGFGFLKTDIKARLLPYIQWIAETETPLTENLLPSYRKNIFSKKLFGAANEFNNLKMIEFHYTEVAYQFFINSNEEDYLNDLVAVLYRTKKENYNSNRDSDGDIRIEFKDAEIAYHKKIVSKWSMAVKHAILMWYVGCRQMLVEDYPLVYGGSNTADTSNYYAGLYTMMRSVAGEKIGTIEKVEQLNVHTAHLELTCIIEDAKKLEEAYKK
jgi:hypothetical protein